MAYLTFKAKECKKGRKFLFRKSEAEQKSIGIDYADELPDGVYIASLTATAVNRRTGADATATVIDSTAIEVDDDGNNTVAVVNIHDGSNGHSYTVTVTVTMDDAFNIDERCFEFNVKACDR